MEVLLFQYIGGERQMNEPQYNPKLTGIQNFKIAFEKGKLEQKKEELKFLKERCIYCMIADERIKQLQKEIGEEKQDDN
jgi:hypothetical protein